MRSYHAYLLFIATLLTAVGYGATFLLTMHFQALGGSEIDTGTTLSGAMVGTLVGVPLVGWFANRVGAARMAALGAALVAAGYLSLAWIPAVAPTIVVAGFFIGLGWERSTWPDRCRFPSALPTATAASGSPATARSRWAVSASVPSSPQH